MDIIKELEGLDSERNKTLEETKIQQQDFANKVKYKLGDEIIKELNKPIKKENCFKMLIKKIRIFVKRINNTLYD